MKKHTKVLACLMLTLVMLLPVCGLSASATGDGEKLELVIMIKSPEDKWMDDYCAKIAEHFPQYNLVFKDWISATAEKDIKTLIASGNPCDVAMYWPNYMTTFVSAGMAYDLTPALEANDGEWMKNFTEGTLDIGKYDGKYYNVAYSPVYPVVVANGDLLAEAGVTFADPTNVTWEEFIANCQALKDGLPEGAFPFVLQNDLSCWTVRNGLLSCWDDMDEVKSFCAGEISFTDERVARVMEESKDLFENYCYPGPGSLTVKFDEAASALQQGKVAMMGTVNTLASEIITTAGIENPVLLTWPMQGPTSILLGGCDGWFIPANAKHPEASIEVLKYMSSPEAMQIMVDGGKPVTALGTQSSDPNFDLYSRDTALVTSVEVINLSSEIFDIVVNKLPAEYVYNGAAVIDELEQYRLEAIQ